MEMNIMINNLFCDPNDRYDPANGDYIGTDGLKYCGKCHTPMQKKVECSGEEHIESVPCKCRLEEMDAEMERQRRYTHEMELMRAREQCFADSILWKWNFENCDDPNDKLMVSMKRYCENFSDLYNDGCGLVLYGPVGVGKTYAAACIANELIENAHTVHMTDFSRIINSLWGQTEGKQKYLDSLNNYDLLIIDDLASQRNTPYANEIVMNVIDSRCKSGKPLIVTTNLSAEDLFKPTGLSEQRIYSRLCQMCIPVLCTANKDRRKEKMKQNIAKYRDKLMLGGRE